MDLIITLIHRVLSIDKNQLETTDFSFQKPVDIDRLDFNLCLT